MAMKHHQTGVKRTFKGSKLPENGFQYVSDYFNCAIFSHFTRENADKATIKNHLKINYLTKVLICGACEGHKNGSNTYTKALTMRLCTCAICKNQTECVAVVQPVIA